MIQLHRDAETRAVLKSSMCQIKVKIKLFRNTPEMLSTKYTMLCAKYPINIYLLTRFFLFFMFFFSYFFSIFENVSCCYRCVKQHQLRYL